MKRTDPTAARLCAAFGCGGCKNQIADDEFLTEHDRFWCQKRKQTIKNDGKASQECPSWAWNGDEAQLKALDQPGLPGVQE